MSIRTKIGLAAAALLVAGAAQAQGVLPAPTMPMPPSFSDAPPKTESQAKRARKPARAQADPAEAGEAAPPRRQRRATTTTQRQSQEIDTRPARTDSRGAMELEDDPRAATPMMQNGRAGVGMRF